MDKRQTTLDKCVMLAEKLFGRIGLKVFTNFAEPHKYVIGMAASNGVEMIKALTPRFKPAELLAYLQGVEMGQIPEQERNEQ